jgi:hypothetical protein
MTYSTTNTLFLTPKLHISYELKKAYKLLGVKFKKFGSVMVGHVVVQRTMMAKRSG